MSYAQAVGLRDTGSPQREIKRFFIIFFYMLSEFCLFNTGSITVGAEGRQDTRLIQPVAA